MISVVSQALLPRRKQVMTLSALSLPPHLCRAWWTYLSKKKLAAVIAFENGVDVSYFGNWYSACQISTGSRVPVQELKDESNPARVCSVPLLTMLASGSLLMLAMTWCMAWPLPGLLKLGPRAARTGRTFLWFFTAVALTEAMSAIQESGATVFVPCVGKDDAVSTSASGALETPKRTPKAEGGGASAGKVAAALAPPAAVASQSTVAISSPSKSPSKQLNLDSLDIKVTKDVVQKHKSAKEARGGGARHDGERRWAVGQAWLSD